MQFDPICKSKIFKDVPEYDKIVEDKDMTKRFSTVFTGMSGRFTRMRIICAITETPMNVQQISETLELDYKTVQHNIRVLEKNNFIDRQGDGYGDIFFPSEIISANLPTLYKVIRRVEKRLEKKNKKYVE